MVKISADIGIEINYSYDLTKEEVEKIKPLKTKLEPYWKETIEGKLVRITDEKRIAELKKNNSPPTGYDVKLVDDLSGIDKGVKQFFLDFLIANTFLGDKPTSEAERSEERYYDYMNIDESDLEEEYPNNADKMLKELESCIKIVKTKIKSSDLLGAIVLLKENNLSRDILTEELSKRLKGLTVGDLTTDKVKEVVDEDYTKIESRKRIAEKRVEDLQLNDKKFAELPDKEKKKIIEDIQRMDNKILVAADQSNPIFNPKILEKYISTKTNEKGLSIIIDTKGYMKELFIDANLGDMDSDDFLFTKKAKNKKEDLDVKESIELFKKFSKENGEVLEWVNSLVDKFVFVSAEREKEEGESSSKYEKYKKERETQLEARRESNNNSKKELENLDFPKEMMDDIIGLMQNSNRYIKDKKLNPDDLATILEKTVEIYNEKEGGESEFSRITEEEFGVEEDNTDDVYVPPENEEDEDLSKQLLKSVLKTITIIKNESEIKTGSIIQGNKTVPKGSILLVERNFLIEEPEKILENSVSKLTEKDKQEEILDITRNVFGTDELGQIIYPTITKEVVDKIVLNNLVAKEDERLISFIRDFVVTEQETGKKKKLGGYNLYSLFSETGKKVMLDTETVAEMIQKEIENFKNEDKVKKRIIELIKEDAKPIKGLADIKSDILLRITPVKNQLEVGKFVLNYKYNIDLKILESEKLQEFLVDSIASKIRLPDSSKRQNYKANEDKARTSSKKIKNVLDGTKLLVDELTVVFKENEFYEYTQNEATPLREEITSEDVDDFVLQFLSGSTNKQQDKIKSFLSEFNSHLRTLDNEIDKLESENDINISDLIKRGELNNPNLIKTIESYIEVIKELGLPEKLYGEKTVSLGRDVLQLERDPITGKRTGKPARYKDSPRTVEELRGKEIYYAPNDFTIPPMDYEAYYEYYKVRNEPFIKWLESLEEDEIKEIFEEKLKIDFPLTSVFVLEIITKIADMGSEYFKDDNIQEKLERYYDPDDDVYNPDFMGKILSLVKEEYQDKGIELDPDDIDDAEKDPVTGKKPTDLFDDNQQMDMETAQDRYSGKGDEFTVRDRKFVMEQQPEFSNTVSDKEAERYAEMVRRKKEGTYYDKFGKMLIKSEDIESGYEDDLFYWMFFWMRNSSRQEVMQAFQDYSNLKFNFDGDTFFELIGGYEDVSESIFSDNNVNRMLASYQRNFIEEIYNKELDKGMLETLEDLGFISILQEKGIPDFDALFEIDFNPYGGTVDSKWRGIVQRTPEKTPKEINTKTEKDKSTAKPVKTRMNIRDRREATELLLDAKNKWQKFERRV